MKKALFFALLVASVSVTKAQSKRHAASTKAGQESRHKPASIAGFLEKNPTVADLSWKSNEQIMIRSKDGKTKTYNLDDPKQKSDFETAYGTAPVAPPPPPPVKPRQTR